MTSRRWNLLKARLSTTLVALLCSAILVDSLLLLASADDAAVKRNLLLQIALLAAFWWWATLRSGTLLSAPFVFVLAIFFWHSSFLAGRYLHLADIFEFSGSALTYGEHFVPAAVALVSLCATSAVVGALIAFRQQRRKWRAGFRGLAGRRSVLRDTRRPWAGPAVARYSWMLFTGYFALTVAYFLFEGLSALSSGDYLNVYMPASQSVLYRSYQMAKFLGVPIIGLVVATSRSRISLWAAVGATLLLMSVTALTGARTMPFLFGAALIVAFDYFRRPVPLAGIAVLALAAAAANWMISESRAVGVGARMLTSGTIAQPISWWHILWNSGGSVRTVLRTMEFSQRSGPEYGRSFLEALVFVIPAPVISVLAPGWKDHPPSEWLIAQSPDVGPGEGLGYSLVAETYLNFGIIGAVLFLFIGWLIAYEFFRFRFRRDVFAGLQAFSLAVLMALHLRNDAIAYVRVLVWGAAAIWIARRLDAASTRRRLLAARESLGGTHAPLPMSGRARALEVGVDGIAVTDGHGHSGWRAAGLGQSDRRRTIALFIPSLGVGGAERQALQLACGLDATRWRVLVLTGTPEPTGEEGTAGAAHIWTGRRKGVALIARLASILDRERVDIVQAYLLGSQVYSLAAKVFARDVRLIMAVRASLELNEIVGWNGKVSHALVFGLRCLVDQYVFNSSSGERAVGRGLAPHKRHVIFNGIDTARFRPDPGAAAFVRALAGAPPDSRIVGMVANVNHHKGYESFVRAAAAISRQMPDVYFVAVGDHLNPMGVGIQALVDALSLSRRFRFLGSRSDPERIIPGMNVVCSASSSEGFSNAIGEAMACGVPCVVTAVGDSPIIVGDTGLVVPPRDPSALADGLRALLQEKPDQLRRRGESARRRIEQNFGVQRMVDSFESLYESLLSDRRAQIHSRQER